MEQYILKAALAAEAAEIERRIKETESMRPKFDKFLAGQISSFKGVLKILDTLEVKEEVNTTDAFIEKAEKWLNEHILDYVYAKEWGQGVGVEGELFDDFKNAMKGE